MALCGLPVKKVWNAVQKFLNKYTDEMPKEKDHDISTNDSNSEHEDGNGESD
jgi:hypothetical protein